jgi:hypothetical protein
MKLDNYLMPSLYVYLFYIFGFQDFYICHGFELFLELFDLCRWVLEGQFELFRTILLFM